MIYVLRLHGKNVKKAFFFILMRLKHQSLMVILVDSSRLLGLV